MDTWKNIINATKYEENSMHVRASRGKIISRVHYVPAFREFPGEAREDTCDLLHFDGLQLDSLTDDS